MLLCLSNIKNGQVRVENAHVTFCKIYKSYTMTIGSGGGAYPLAGPSGCVQIYLLALPKHPHTPLMITITEITTRSSKLNRNILTINKSHESKHLQPKPRVYSLTTHPYNLTDGSQTLHQRAHDRS